MHNPKNGAGVITEFSADQLIPWPGLNPRRSIDPEKLEELTASVREDGVLQPILVHDTGEPVKWIVAGETRWRAAKAAESPIPAIVKLFTEAKALRVALLENMHRNNLTAIEEARGFKHLLELEPDLTQEQLGAQIGKSQAYVANRIRLLELPEAITALIEAGTISASHARDYLAPFVRIPTKVRATLFKKFLTEIQHDRRGGGRETGDPLSGEDVQQAISYIARELSLPLSDRGHYGQEEPLFEPRAHKKCTCGGPVFAYDYGKPHVRCFAPDWWHAEQAAAKKRIAEEERAEKKKAEASADTAELQTMDRQAFSAKYGYGIRALTDEVLDASQLGGASFVIVSSDYGNGPQPYCTDKNALAKAKRAANKVKTELLAEKKGARAAKYLALASKTDVEPWMLAEILAARPQNDTLLDVGREIGMDVGKHGQLRDTLRALPADQVTTLFKVLALRSKAEDLQWQDPIEQEVDKIIKKKFTPGMLSLRKKLLKKAGLPVSNGKKAKADFADLGYDSECIKCGCTDSNACEGGCSWLAVDRDEGIGVCSSCAESKQEAEKMLAEDRVPAEA